MTHNIAASMIWWGAFLMMAVVVIAMATRRLFSEMPVFGAFAVYEVIGNVIIHWTKLHRSVNAFFYAYWGGQLIEAVLTLLIIQEIFTAVLRPYGGLRAVGPKIYWISALVFTSVAIWMDVSTPKAMIARVTTGLIVAERSISFIQISLLLILFVFCRLFGLRWRHYTFGVALGFSVSACFLALAGSIQVQVGWANSTMYQLTAPLSFDVGAFVWGCYMVSKESIREIPAVPLSPQLAKWNSALEQLVVR